MLSIYRVHTVVEYLPGHLDDKPRVVTKWDLVVAPDVRDALALVDSIYSGAGVRIRRVFSVNHLGDVSAIHDSCQRGFAAGLEVGIERGMVRMAAKLQTAALQKETMENNEQVLRIEKLETDTAKLQNDADGLAITYDVLKSMAAEIDALKARVKVLEKSNS